MPAIRRASDEPIRRADGSTTSKQQGAIDRRPHPLDEASLPRRDNGSFYAGWLTTVDGDLFPVGTFHDGVKVTLWAGVELERVEMFTITLEAAAGRGNEDQGSSGEVVLRTEINP